MITRDVKITTTISPESYEADQISMRLLAEAKAAADRAYAPYSKFYVGAAALLANGEIVSGNNQENAAYPSGLCAERVTIFYANSRYPGVAITHLLIYAQTDEGPVGQPITPCGACRQVIIEKQNTQGCPMCIMLAGREVIYRIGDASELMPLSFIPDSLKGE